LIENIFVFAGVPKIMQAMTIAAQDHLIPGKIAKVKTVNSFVTEGSIAKLLTDLQNEFSEIEIGSYPFIKDSKLGTAIVFRGYDDKKIDKAILQYEEFLKSHNYQIF